MLIIKKDCTMTDLTASQARKEGLLEQLAGGQTEELRGCILSALADKGAAIKVTHRKQLVGCLVFVRETADADTLAAEHPEIGKALRRADGEKGEEKRQVQVLRLAQRLAAPEWEARLSQLEQDDEVKREAAMSLLEEPLLAMAWNGGYLTAEPSGFSPVGWLLGIPVGVCLGLAMGNLPIGIALGMALGLCFGSAFSAGKK